MNIFLFCGQELIRRPFAGQTPVSILAFPPSVCPTAIPMTYSQTPRAL